MMERVHLNYEILMCMSKAFIKGEAEEKNRHESKQRQSVTVKLSMSLHHQARQTLSNLKPAAAAAGLDINVYIVDAFFC